MNEMKVKRGRLRGSVTKSVSRLQLLMSTEDVDKVKECISKIEENYSALEVYHEEMEEAATTVEQIDECDDYITKVQVKCSEAIHEAKVWLSSRKEGVAMIKADIKVEKVAEDSVKQVQDSQTANDTAKALKEIATLVSLPSVEIDNFDGDPLKYHSFMAVFDDSIDKVISSDSAKLTRLLRYTTGKAYEAIQSCSIVGGTVGYSTAKKILIERFGNPVVIAERMTALLRDGKPVKSSTDLTSLSNDLSNCDIAMTRIGDLQELNSQHFIASVINRLQVYQKNKWKKIATDMKTRKARYPNFGELCEFVKTESMNASDPIYGEDGLLTYGSRSTTNTTSNPQYSTQRYQPRFQPPPRQTQSRTFATQIQGRKCLICQLQHPLYICEQFKALKQEDRLKFVKDNKLCVNCFLNNHDSSNCFKSSRCGIDGCNDKHSRLLHAIMYQYQVTGDTTAVKSSGATSIELNHDICLPTVKVKVNNSIDTMALLDTCSNSTFCSKDLVKRLKVLGIPVNLELSTLNSVACHTKSRIVPNIVVEGSEGQSLILKNVCVIDEIPIKSCGIDVQKFTHISDIPVQPNVSKVDLLIGQDNSAALVPLEVRKSDDINKPFAVKTILGWSIHGKANESCINYCGMIYNKAKKSTICHFIGGVTVNQPETIEEKLDKLWTLDNDDEQDYECDVQMSKKESEVLELWNDSVTVNDDEHYEFPIPWKDGVAVPNNYDVAFKRLQSLKHSLSKKGLFKRYDCEIQKLMTKKYAEKIPVNDVGSNLKTKIWYLPHHAVITEKKPDKLRVVFDCAAKFEGSSLNDKCKQGPDLNNKLIHVLLRFRQFQYAIMADVEAMYYQVHVSPEDRDALRFLWFDEDDNIQEYRMRVHIFGGVWCSCIATYALRRTLEDQEVTDPFIRKVIEDSFYVDDCLQSADDISKLQRVLVDVKQVLRLGGFNLTKFISNNENLVEEIPLEDRAKEVKEFNAQVHSKALGIKWEVVPDSFSISIGKLYRSDSPVTKRQMLSVLASMYDPLGLVSPCVMKGKMIFQDATRLKVDWNCELPADLIRRWKIWVKEVEDLQSLQYPRCLMPNEFVDSSIEIHNFCDASEKGYGCNSYIRCVKGKEVHVSLIASKGRLCPIKQISIPRLELQAAVLAVDMNHMIINQLDVNIHKSYFWTDSQIVLAYIQNETKRFKIFVANRVTQIRSRSNKEQWNYVPSKLNPADLISRGTDPNALSQPLWMKGPEFISEPNLPSFLEKEELKENQLEIKMKGKEESKENQLEIKKKRKEELQEIKMKEEELSDEEIDIKANTMTVQCSAKEQHFIDKIIQRHSSWYKIRRIVARLIQIKDSMKKKTKIGDLTVEELKKAEILIIKHVQTTSFPNEIQNLKEEGFVTKKSDIRSLCPIINEEGLMSVGGRISEADEDISKHPYILSYKHPLVEKLVRYYHEKAHVGTEWTLALIRKKFWITKARIVIKRVLKDCVTCRKLFRKPMVQRMAELPKERLEAFQSPFTNVGLDCFGPFFVKMGRATVKRYGCIFTCLNIRAIHLEKLNTLETDSFINGFRRFISRKGTPSKLWSDNGTNFVGAETELSRDVKDFLLKKNIAWHFNPPHASHMGGIWERQIRTVRKVLQGLLEKYPGDLTDEILETLFCEVEAMVNSRPITKLSDDENDGEAITPNQLLLIGNGPQYYPSDYKKSDLIRRRWRFVQHLSNQFWKKWMKMYLPELQRRQKWHKEHRNLKVGDLVLLTEEITPRFLWPMGKVVEVKLGRDGLVRVVRVKTNTTTLIRPISKVISLEY